MSKTSINDNYWLKIEILTPTHIGGSSEKHWAKDLDYFYHQNQVFVAEQHRLFKLLGKNEVATWSAKVVSGDSEDFKKYLFETKKLDFDSISELKFQLSQEPENEIKSLFRSGLGKPTLSGSSLKGAIESIILNELVEKSNIRNKKKKIFDKNTKSEKEVKYYPDEYQDELFGKLRDNNMLMRLLRITDAEFEESELYNTKIFNLFQAKGKWVAGWKHSQNGGNTEEFKNQGFTTPYETFSVGDLGVCRLGFATEIFNLIKQKSPNNKPTYADSLFTQNSIQDLFKIINQYTSNYLQKELDFFEEFSNDKTDIIKEQLEILKQKTTKENSCVLRMSAGSGYHSITGDWNFADHIDVGEWNNGKRKYKSRKFAFDYESNVLILYPMGFIKLTVISEDEIQKLATEKVRLKEERTKKQQEKQLAILLAHQKAEEERLAREAEKQRQDEAAEAQRQAEEEEARKPKIKTVDKLKVGEIVDAIVLRMEGKQLVYRIFVEGYETKEFKTTYPAGFEKDTIITVKINDFDKQKKIIRNLNEPKKK